MKRFSDQFPTFFDWKNHIGKSSYAKKIERLHFLYPDATLSQLTGRKKLTSRKLGISIVDTRGLTPKERSLRIKSLSVLNRIRRGENPQTVLYDANISKKVLIDYLGNNIRISNRSVKVTKRDDIPRQMVISENGLETSVIIKGSKSASIIGRYQNAKRYFLETGDDSRLKEFSKVKLRDTDGKTHRLETDARKIIEIEDRKEEPESFEIYQS